MWFKHGLKIHDNIKGNIKMRVCHEPMTHPQHIFLINLWKSFTSQESYDSLLHQNLLMIYYVDACRKTETLDI